MPFCKPLPARPAGGCKTASQRTPIGVQAMPFCKPLPARPAERILAAADKLFYSHGIRAIGVDAVAAEAGVSKRTLYNHYPSKDELIAAYLTARLRHPAPSDAP